jgi:nucleotide-binding universal stress UspA family protein
MTAHGSNKLKNAMEGALAGGGDAATSPLYVFGPFLRLVLAAGIAQIAFGGSVWLAVLTIAVVSAMYRLVMQWVTDGSGGSGLSEEEFGGWAVKVNAAITFVEYTLTFLVSMSAMVTFIADRIPTLNQSLLGIQYRSLVAIILSLLTGWLVNRGPRMAAGTFGPATAGVLLLLWSMILATIIKMGFHLPVFSLQAFDLSNLHYTIGGYVRILAVMTGIEVFANLVPAYGGAAAQKSRKAFASMLIIMGTTALTMLIVGPAIFSLADPANIKVSVFTQAMDQLLPAPIPYLGSLVGIFVLMSASAASAQGLQNLALGLKERHYIPPVFGTQNQYEVAPKPVWLQVSIVSLCFVLFGTHEETYLALYAAGVFVLLSMTGWAVTKRLVRQVRQKFSLTTTGAIFGTSVAALLTTAATLIIFEERFFEGAWAYFFFIPALFLAFTFFRNRIGAPSPEMEYLGHINSHLLAGFGFGQSDRKGSTNGNSEEAPPKFVWKPEPEKMNRWHNKLVDHQHILLLLDGSNYAAQAIPMTQFICETTGAHLTLLSASQNYDGEPDRKTEIGSYLSTVAEKIHAAGIQVNSVIRSDSPSEVTHDLVIEKGIDLVVTTARGGSGEKNWLREGLSEKLVRLLDIPVLLVQVFESGPPEAPHMGRILIALDGSAFSEQALPYARFYGKAFDCELMLISVPAIPESEKYRAPASLIHTIRKQAEGNMHKYLESIAETLRAEGLVVRTIVTGSYPARTVVDVGKREGVDLILITSQGRGGLDLIFMGSVAQQVVQLTDSPVLIVPINHEPEVEKPESSVQVISV